MQPAESELESFRQQWREEVSRKAKSKGPSEPHAPRAEQPRPTARPSSKQSNLAPPSSSGFATKEHERQAEDSHEPYSFDDLGDKEEGLKLGASPEARKAALGSEPESALDHYEKAVEKESIGNLGDSVSLYRKAFKLDEGVHEAYKQKHFASSWKKPAHGSSSGPSAAPAGPPKPATDDAPPAAAPPASTAPAVTVAELIASFAGLSIPRAEPETSLSAPPPCPISRIPTELLEDILHAVAAADPGTLARVAPVCKRLAYLTSAHDALWKRLVFSAQHGLAGMHYRYAVDLRGAPLPLARAPVPIPDATPGRFATYRAQFRGRPRVRFGGAYISTVNYTRPGGHSLAHFGDDGRPARARWTAASPVHIVTYYRYLRFFRDGSVVSLLTVAEPADVVPFLLKEHVPEQPAPGAAARARRPRGAGAEQDASAAAGAGVMREALLGRWRLSGPASGPAVRLADDDGGDGDAKRPGWYAKEPLGADGDDADGEEEEGTLHVETQGVVPKYMWKMAFAVGTAGGARGKDAGGPRSTRLGWKGFWSYNRLTDDWGEFALKNDRPFYWSRVRSYGVGE